MKFQIADFRLQIELQIRRVQLVNLKFNLKSAI